MNPTFTRRSILVSLFAIILLLVFWQGPQEAETIHEFGGATMGTTYSIKVVDDHAQASSELLALEVGELLQHLDREVMSTYSATSELSELNRAAIGENLSLSQDMASVLALALEVHRLTSGAFDVTVGPLVNRWGFGPEDRAEDRIPDQAEIEALKARVGSDKLALNRENGTLTKLADVYIDLSGIAKGYAVDQVALFLESRGLTRYFIEIGGELRISGNKPGDESWVPAIEKPVDTAPQIHAIFYAKGESIAVAGSGDYRNYFDQDGQHYSHEIDPHTGRPVTHRLAGVYVIDASAARADALATAFMVMGAESAARLAEDIGLAVYFISKTESGEGFEDHYTSRFAHYLSPT